MNNKKDIKQNDIVNNNKELKEIVNDNDYKYGFVTDVKNVYDTGKGLSEEVIRKISAFKNEPDWMLDFRLKAYNYFINQPDPTWGPDLSGIDYDALHVKLERDIEGSKRYLLQQIELAK